MNKIYRSFDGMQADIDSRRISGRAIVFEAPSRDLGGFTEVIHRSAVTQDLVDASDVVMNLNHDNTMMLARRHSGAGTLNLELREDGLWFSFDAPPTQLGDEVLYNVRAGNLFECSFCFSLPRTDTAEKWSRQDGKILREINEIGSLYDCSIVTRGAYSATSVSNRDMQAEQVDVQEIERQLDEADKQVKRAEITKKYAEDVEKYTKLANDEV